MRVLALLSLLAAAPSASDSRLRFRLHHAKASASSSSSTSSSSTSGACAALASDSAASEPVFTTQCPSVCGQQSACIVYPLDEAAACPSDQDRSCYREAGCSVECLKTMDDSTSWYFTFFDNDQAMYNALLENADEQYASVIVNASLVHHIAAFENVDELTSLTFTGNEPASDLENNDDVLMPRDDIVSLHFPETFLHSLETLEYIRLENVRLPNMSANAVDSLPTFEQLTTLYLSNCHLESVPVESRKLPALTDLDLSYNHIASIPSGSLPTELLQYLDLSLNPLTAIPSDVKQMNQLTNLFLKHLDLREILPGTLPASVTTLGIGNCSLSAIPQALEKLTALSSLDLSWNSLGAQSPLDLSVLSTNLTSLDLTHTELEEMPADLPAFSSLATLVLSSNINMKWNVSRLPPAISDLSLDDCNLSHVPSDLDTITSITSLSLNGNALVSLSPGSLPSSLTTLSLGQANFTEISANVLPSTLEALTIDRTPLEKIPEDLSNMDALSALTLSKAKLTEFPFLSNLQTLTSLDLNSNDLTAFDASLPNAESINLSHNRLTGINFTFSSSLDYLDLSFNNLTTFPDDAFEMTGLLSLYLIGNPIVNFTPTQEQYGFLSQMDVLQMDVTQFSTDCSSDQLIDLLGYSICSVTANATATEGDSGDETGMAAGSMWIMILGACTLALILAGAVWHHYTLKKEMKSTMLAKSELQELKKRESQLWQDDLLMKHRLEMDSIFKVKILASGMFGEVWLATYHSQYVAVKCLKEEDPDREEIQQFVDEIKLMATCSHTRIVQFFGVAWTKESDLQLVTEYMERGDLRNYLDEARKGNPSKPVDWDLRHINIALDIAEALVYLHSLDPPVVHRDLKARNVLLGCEWQAKLTDFGTAKAQQALEKQQMTACVGTLRWMAPEVMTGEEYDSSADIFSFGIVLSEMDTRELPYFDACNDDGELLSETTIARRVVEGSLQASFSSSCPPVIETLAHRCCSHGAEDRPNALYVAYELRQFLRQQRTKATAASTGAAAPERNDSNTSRKAPHGTISV